MIKFYVGLHHVGDAAHFARACLSIRHLHGRRKPIPCPDVLVDSGAFSEILLHGGYHAPVSAYAAELRRLHEGGIVRIGAAVAQDYMCEPMILAKTGMTIADHQRLTIERYDALLAEGLPFHIMPVLQGYAPDDYRRHVAAYGDRLQPGHWVGVGSVCKRNSKPEQIAAVLTAVAAERPDLKKHGFGVKSTALANNQVWWQFHTADSMAWSYAARRQGRDANCWMEARRFADRIEGPFG